MDKENDSKPNTSTLECEVLPDDYSQYDYSFKIIVIGDSGVGKSCLTLKATKNLFENHYAATVGFEFFTFNSRIDNKVIKLQIWDTCGQEIYRSLIANFYRNSSLAFLIYSIDSRDSFKNLELWMKDLRTMANPDVKIFLIGNKTDLVNKRQVSYEDGEQFYKSNNLDYFNETSAKTGFNTKNVFIEASKLLYEESLKYKGNPRTDSIVSYGKESNLNAYNPHLKLPDSKPLNLEEKPTQSKKKKKCC